VVQTVRLTPLFLTAVVAGLVVELQHSYSVHLADQVAVVLDMVTSLEPLSFLAALVHKGKGSLADLEFLLVVLHQPLWLLAAVAVVVVLVALVVLLEELVLAELVA